MENHVDLRVKIITSDTETDKMTYMPLSFLSKITFLDIYDDSTPTLPMMKGSMVFDGKVYGFSSHSASGEVVFYIKQHEYELVYMRIVLPLSVDPNARYAIHVPSDFCTSPHSIPNEVVYEFLRQWCQKSAPIEPCI
jgi:hypothetical protein